MSKINLLPLLNYIPCNVLDYDNWLHVGMALKAEGYSCVDWENWSSSDPVKFHPGVCQKKWDSFKSSGITGAFIVELAKSRGWSGSSERYNPPVRNIPSPAPVKEVERTRNVSDLPDPLETDNLVSKDCPEEDQFTAFIQNLFYPGEWVNIVSESFKGRDGKLVPLVNRDLFKMEDAALPHVKGEGGAWFRVNPVKNPLVSSGNGIKDEDVAAFRHTLIESDDLSPKDQLNYFLKLRLPVSAMVWSGGKSIHAFVKVDAENETQYKERVSTLHNVLRSYGITVDKANKNPSRLARIPGVLRNKERQKLIYLNAGCKDWDTWIEFIKEVDGDLDFSAAGESEVPLPDDQDDPFNGILPQEINVYDPAVDGKEFSRKHEVKRLSEIVGKNLPKESPVIIDGLLRHGGVMMLSGPSKLGKTFSLIELGLILAHGDKWMGRKCTPSKVLYLDFEINEASGAHRINDVLLRRGYSCNDDAADRFLYFNFFGDTLTPDQLVQRAVEENEVHQFDVLIVDPIYYVLQGNENDSDNVKALVSKLRRICSLCNCSVIFSHHHSKGGQATKSAMDRASGSGVWARDCDCIVDMLELEVSETVKESLVQSGKCKEDEVVSGIQLEYVVRYFKTPPRETAFYVWPLHFEDDSGLLLNARSAIEARAYDAKHRNGKKQIDWEGIINQAFEACEKNSPDGKVKRDTFYQVVMDWTGSTSTETIRKESKKAGYHPTHSKPSQGIPSYMEPDY